MTYLAVCLDANAEFICVALPPSALTENGKIDEARIGAWLSGKHGLSPNDLCFVMETDNEGDCLQLVQKFPLCLQRQKNKKASLATASLAPGLQAP